MSWEEQAKMYYVNDSEIKRNKAIAAGIAMDNALKKEYSETGRTHSHFMMDNWLKYFSYESLGERVKHLYKKST